MSMSVSPYRCIVECLSGTAQKSKLCVVSIGLGVMRRVLRRAVVRRDWGRISELDLKLT